MANKYGIKATDEVNTMVFKLIKIIENLEKRINKLEEALKDGKNGQGKATK